VARDQRHQLRERDEIAVSSGLGHREHATRVHDPPNLVQARTLIRNLAEHSGDQDGIEGRVSQRQTRTVTLHERRRRRGPNAVASNSQHLRLQIEQHDRPSGGTHEPRAEEARAASQLEHPGIGRQTDGGHRSAR